MQKNTYAYCPRYASQQVFTCSRWRTTHRHLNWLGTNEHLCFVQDMHHRGIYLFALAHHPETPKLAMCKQTPMFIVQDMHPFSFRLSLLAHRPISTWSGSLQTNTYVYQPRYASLYLFTCTCSGNAPQPPAVPQCK